MVIVMIGDSRLLAKHPWQSPEALFPPEMLLGISGKSDVEAY